MHTKQVTLQIRHRSQTLSTLEKNNAEYEVQEVNDIPEANRVSR